MMLLEVLRRAAHDWILYRHSSRLLQKQIAEEAFHWVFSEEPGTPAWIERAMSKKELTSFVSVCEVLSLDPEIVRTYIRRLTVKEILSTGRPPTYRRQKDRRRKPVLLLLPAAQPIILVVPKLMAPVSRPLERLMTTAQRTAAILKTLIETQG